MSTEKDAVENSDITEQQTKESNNTTSETLLDKEIDKEKEKINKKLSEFEINELIKKNEKLIEEVKTLKIQIVSLNVKINEQIITINNNKLNYDKE